MTDLARAKKLYRGFREGEPTRVRRIAVPKTPRALAVLGYLDFVGYSTTHAGKSTRYKHDFAAGSRPLLCSDGRRLYILEGRYRVTARGIVDINQRGREEK